MVGSLKKVLGLRIRAARQRSGFTQEELASRVARTPESISNIERGLQSPSIETVAELARVLGMPIAEFFEDWPRAEPELSIERIVLESRLREVARLLSDRDLAIAVIQASAFLEAVGHGKI